MIMTTEKSSSKPFLFIPKMEVPLSAYTQLEHYNKRKNKCLPLKNVINFDFQIISFAA